MASESVENYLKAIYKLEQECEWVPTGRIADRLGVSPPSVSRMIKKLSLEESLSHSPYRGVRLTKSGQVTALRVIRNHRILESYLVQFLGIAWDIVDGEVERLEHAVSDNLINRMEEALGFPTQDPHGAPIPNRHGELPKLDGTVTLLEMKSGEEGLISRVSDGSPELLSYLEKHGMIPGAIIRFEKEEPFGGPIMVTAKGEQVHLGRELCGRVHLVLQPSNYESE